jgi:hypothetical protein
MNATHDFLTIPSSLTMLGQTERGRGSGRSCSFTRHPRAFHDQIIRLEKTIYLGACDIAPSTYWLQIMEENYRSQPHRLHLPKIIYFNTYIIPVSKLFNGSVPAQEDCSQNMRNHTSREMPKLMFISSMLGGPGLFCAGELKTLSGSK